MGTAVLRGVSGGLLVTMLTLLGGMLWNSMGLGGVNAATIVDIGIFLSCVVGGYRTGKESGVWVLGGVTGALFVGIGALLLALFLPLRAAGVLQVMLEGGVLGLVAGAVGARGAGAGLGGGASWRGPVRSGGYAPRYRSYSGDDSEPWQEEPSAGPPQEGWEFSVDGQRKHGGQAQSGGEKQGESDGSEWDRLFGKGGHSNLDTYERGGLGGDGSDGPEEWGQLDVQQPSDQVARSDRGGSVDRAGRPEWESISDRERASDRIGLSERITPSDRDGRLDREGLFERGGRSGQEDPSQRGGTLREERKAVGYGQRAPWWEEEVRKG